MPRYRLKVVVDLEAQDDVHAREGAEKFLSSFELLVRESGCTFVRANCVRDGDREGRNVLAGSSGRGDERS